MFFFIQFNFRIGSVGHIYLIAGSIASPMALAQTIQEDAAFKSLPTYLLAKHFADQIHEAGFIQSGDVHETFRPKQVIQVGFTETEFLKLFGSMPVESIAAFDLRANPVELR